MSTCPDCKNEFFHPFVCSTCGAEKLYDATLEAVKVELAALRSKVAELDAANVGLAQESHDLQQICRDAYEVWAGSEGIPIPQTTAEAYLLSLLEQMSDEVKRGLK